MGIRKDNIANFKKDKKGTSKLFNAVENFECALMEAESTINWKQELDEYLEENSN